MAVAEQRKIDRQESLATVERPRSRPLAYAAVQRKQRV
jgi:hypothetical protein